MNQAVGRVIRHRHDYGAIIFCDERFFSLLILTFCHRFTKMHKYVDCFPVRLAQAPVLIVKTFLLYILYFSLFTLSSCFPLCHQIISL